MDKYYFIKRKDETECKKEIIISHLNEIYLNILLKTHNLLIVVEYFAFF